VGRAPDQQGDDLDMGCLGEHVKRLEKAQGIPPFSEKPDIPCLCCRIAGDIDDPLRPHGRHRVDNPLAAAVAWRIENDRLYGYPPHYKLVFQDIGHIAGLDLRLHEAFAAEIEPCEAGRLPVPLDDEDPSGPGSEKEGKETRAAIGVDDRLST